MRSVLNMGVFQPRENMGIPTLRSAGLLFSGSVLALGSYAMPVRLGVVQGHSMEPTLTSGQCFLYQREGVQPAALQRGDIVVVRMGGQVCVKRIFALGGDRFWSASCGEHSDVTHRTPVEMGVPIARFKKRFPCFNYEQFTVPPHSVYVLGDGICSLDSRDLGPVPATQVLGRVVLPGAGDPGASCATLAWTPQPNRQVRKARS